MMKIASNRYFVFGFSVMSVVSLLMPVSVSALTPEERMDKRQEKMTERQVKQDERMAERKEQRQELFCSRFVENARKISGNLTERRSQLKERKDNRGNMVETRRNEREMKLQGNRSDADERRTAMYEKLSKRAKTDEQQAALAVFKKTVEEAVETRRDAVDLAISEFRRGVDQAVAGRKDDMETAGERFKTAVEANLDQAQKGCENGTDQATIRTDFKSGLQSARAALANDRKASDKVGEQVKALAEIRRGAVKKALDEFKATLASARAELKKAFGETTETEVPSTP